MYEKTNIVNAMCKSCARFENDCNGSTNPVWTGCVYKKHVRKMHELYNAHYSDGRTVYEKTLEEIYTIQGNSKVTITPTIWLWKATGAPVFFVDYVGDGISCTLSTFDNLRAAQEYREKISSMDEKAFENWLINVRLAKKEA